MGVVLPQQKVPFEIFKDPDNFALLCAFLVGVFAGHAGIPIFAWWLPASGIFIGTMTVLRKLLRQMSYGPLPLPGIRDLLWNISLSSILYGVEVLALAYVTQHFS